MRRVLVIGLGGVGQRHTRNLRSLYGDTLEILAFRSRRLSHVLTPTLSIEDGADVEKKYSIKGFTDLSEALSHKPETAFICNPSSMHIPVALQAAEAGCHLFLEKPVSNDLIGIDKLMAVVARKSLVTFVGYQLRFHPGVRRVRELLAMNAIGKVLAVNAEVGEYLPSWHKYEDYRQMYASRKELGGGVILSQIHEMDYLYSWFGLPRSVYASGGHLSSLEIDVEDIASIMMEFGDGPNMIPVHLHQDYMQRPPSRTCKIIGDCGRIELSFSAGTLVVYDTNGQKSEERDFKGFDRNEMFLAEIRHFMDCVEKKIPSDVMLADGVASLRMALAAKAALQSRRWEKLP